MLDKLRKKIVYINVLLVSLVLIGTFSVICFNSYNSSKDEFLLSLKMENKADLFNQGSAIEEIPEIIGGTKNHRQDDKPRYTVSYVRLIVSNGIVISTSENNATIDNDLLNKSLKQILNSENESDVIFSLGVAYAKKSFSDGTMSIVLADSQMLSDILFRTILTCVFLYIAALAVIIMISIWLSSIAVKPVETAWKQQKQFISDASHELKTPLTVILANNNILNSHKEETIDSQIRWIESTRDEAEHMKGLIDRMLTLAKSDEEKYVPNITQFSLSELAQGNALYFESAAYEKGISLVTNCYDDIFVNSDKEMVSRIINILLDNAVKYGFQGTDLTISVSGGSCPELLVTNICESISDDDIKHLFDRFYRTDKARGKNGYGLGLSIAKAHAEALKLGLDVNCQGNKITFTLKFKR